MVLGKHIIIPDKVHELVRVYCFINKLKIYEFVEKVFMERPEIKDLDKRMKDIRFN